MTADDDGATTTDRRSVGELLLDADLTSRAALWNPDADLARARVRTWGEVVETAADLWAAIPDTTADPCMQRIHGITQALSRTHRRTQWPGAGPGDPHLESVATSFARAAELVTAHAHPTTVPSSAARLDAEAARTRIMHVLYVSAHGVGAALDRHTRELQHRPDTRQTIAPGDTPNRARDTGERIAAVERLAGSYLHTRWPAALAGEHRESMEVSRLEKVLARWDLQAHRTLAGPLTVANLDWVARVQKDLTVASGTLGAVVASRSLTDLHQHADRVSPALARLEQAWGRIAQDLEPLIGRQRRIDPELLLAGNDVRAVLRGITHQNAGFASPETIAARVDLPGTTATLHRGLLAAVDLAHVVRDAIGDPELSVAARGANALARTSGTPQTVAASVPAGDLYYNRATPLPTTVRAILTGYAQDVIEASIIADSAGAALRATRTPPNHQATIDGRHYQDRIPATGRGQASVPAMGCDR